MGLLDWLFGTKIRRKPSRPPSKSRPRLTDTTKVPPPPRLAGATTEETIVTRTRVDDDRAYDDDIRWDTHLFPAEYRIARRPECIAAEPMIQIEIQPTGAAAETFYTAIFDHLNDYDEFIQPMQGEDDERAFSYSLGLRKSGDNINVVHIWHGWDGDKAKPVGRLPAAALSAIGDMPLKRLHIEMVEARLSDDGRGKPLAHYTIEIHERAS